MKLTTIINGKQFVSHDKPGMGLIRQMGKVSSFAEDVQNDTEKFFEYLDTTYDFIKAVFPAITQEDIDSLEIDVFNQLITEISVWVSGSGTQKQISDEKKT